MRTKVYQTVFLVAAKRWDKISTNLMTICSFIATLLLIGVHQAALAQEPTTKIRISNSALSVTALPLVAAREWNLFREQGLQAEVIMMNPAISNPAIAAGEIDYTAGVGPGSVAATLAGLPLRAVWFSSNRISYFVTTSPQNQSLQDLKGKKIGITGGLGGTNHVALIVALEKLGFNPKDFIILTTPTAELLRSLESGFVDAASLNPPTVFFAQRKGFHRVLDIGSLVEMPGGGLTTLIKTIKSKPDEVRKVIRSLQTAKDAIRKSRDKTVELMVRTLKMDRDIASSTYDVYLRSLSIDGVPAPEGMNNLVRSVKAQGRFADRTISFEDVADDSLAKEVAKELGYKPK
jgi:ABC-type nitrate/sulfonate/bicarbonate transport system substrate-binding protein